MSALICRVQLNCSFKVSSLYVFSALPPFYLNLLQIFNIFFCYYIFIFIFRHLNIRDCQKVSEKALVRTLELCPELYKLNVAFLNISLRDILLKGNPIQLKTLVVSDRKFISPIPNLTIQVAAWPFTSLKIQTNEQPFQFFPCRTIQ